MSKTTTKPKKSKRAKAPEDLQAEVLDLRRQVAHNREIRDKVRLLREHKTKLKSAIKASTGQIDELLDSLLVDDTCPLFDPMPTPAPSANGKPHPPTGDDAWRAVPIDHLKVSHELPAALVAKLAENNLLTLGQLADFQAAGAKKHNGQWWADLVGFGEKKAEDVSAALDRFWAWRKDAGEKLKRAAEELGNAGESPQAEK